MNFIDEEEPLKDFTSIPSTNNRTNSSPRNRPTNRERWSESYVGDIGFGNGFSENSDSDDDDYDDMMTPTLQNFLSHYGVMASASFLENQEGTERSTRLVTSEQFDSIFESSFDLTDERLKYVFAMFDTDKDGLIDYENLRKGLELHTGGMMGSASATPFAKKSFDNLVKILDADGSMDITYNEFSRGMRYLMLRALFQVPDKVAPTNATVDIFDYDAQKIVRRSLVNKLLSNKDRRATIKLLKSGSSSLVIEPLAATDFFFGERPPWVKTRWINVWGGKCALTLKKLAVRYRIHPLALEDALSPERQRPKAEVYSNHYFIMIPIFCVIPPTDEDGESARSKDRSHSKRSLRRLLSCFKIRRQKKEVKDSFNAVESENNFPRVGKIKVQMTSLFVNVPTNDTIITYNSEEYVDTLNGMKDLDESERYSSRVGPEVESWRKTSPKHCWDRIYNELTKSYSKLRQYDAQYLTYALLDKAVDLLEPIIVVMRKEIALETLRLESTKYESLDRIHKLKSELEKIVRKLKPFQRLLVHVIEDDAISPGPTIYLRDVLDNLESHDEEFRELIKDCEKVDAAADKFQSRQMDKTLYALTVLSAVFLPAQFLTGVWGMNFESMEELDEPWGYKMFWIVSSSVVIFMIIALNFGRIS